MTSGQAGGGGGPVPLSRRSRKSLLPRLALVLLLFLAGLVVISFVDANWRFARLPSGAPARIFSAPFVVAEDQALERNDLEERLIRLGYHKVEGHPKTPGEFSRRLLSLEIYLNS